METTLPDKPSPEDIQTTLLRLAKPKMTAKELLKQVKRGAPEGVEEGDRPRRLASVISVVDSDVDKALRYRTSPSRAAAKGKTASNRQGERPQRRIGKRIAC